MSTGEARPEAPGKVEAVAGAVAGPAFALSALLLRDATLLPSSVLDGLAAALAALGLAPLAHRRFGAPAGTLARGAGFALGALLLTPALVPPFDRAVPPAALWILGATLLQANARAARERGWPAAAGGLALAGGAMLAFVVAPDLPEPARLRVAVVVGGVAAAAGLAARVRLAGSRWRALAPAPVGVLLVSAFGAVYLAYRGLVEAQVDNLPLYEWSLAVLAAGLLLSRVRRQARERAAPDAWASDARRHAQDVAPVYDRRMAPVVAAVSRWLDAGVGFEDYRAVMERAGGGTPALARALDEAAALRGGKPGRAAADARLAAHRAVLRELNAPRGSPHGDSPPRVRAHP